MSRGLLRSNRERTVCVRGAYLSRCRSSLVFDAMLSDIPGMRHLLKRRMLSWHRPGSER